MTQTFICLRIDLIEKRFQEIETLLNEAILKKDDSNLYTIFLKEHCPPGAR